MNNNPTGKNQYSGGSTGQLSVFNLRAALRNKVRGNKSGLVAMVGSKRESVVSRQTKGMNRGKLVKDGWTAKQTNKLVGSFYKRK